LIQQARALAPATEHFLRLAGIVSGMRVLDIGCGMGDVTMLVAHLVGDGGRVVSIDINQASLDTARKRALAMGFGNTTFHRADISTFTDVEPFDAVVGRLVLEFVPDPTGAISRLSKLLRPGGIMAFQEPSWKVWLTYTSHLPLRTAVTTLIRDTFIAGGANLTPPQLRIDLPVGDSVEFRDLLYELLIAVWPRVKRSGYRLRA